MAAMRGERRSRTGPAGPALLLLILVGFALRLFRLDAQPIWWDEAISIHLATSGVGDLLADRAAHVHPPLYFLLLKGWVGLAGSSAFGVRLLSALGNTLLIPGAYAFARRWVGRRTGPWAALLVAPSPLYVVYAQEARVYALLPVIYLALLALTERLTRPSGESWQRWLLFAGVQVVGLYLHYVFLFGAVYANLRLLLHLRRRRRSWARWLTSGAVVILCCLPWALAVLTNWGAVMADVSSDAPFAEPVPLDHFARLLWGFQWSGWIEAPAQPALWSASLALAGLLTLGVLWLLARRRTRASLRRLLAHWLVPLSGAFLMWRVKPLAHPRYVALFTVALLLVCAHVLARLLRRAGAPVARAGRALLAGLLGAALLSTSLIALRAYYFDPRFAKDDTRGVAALLAERAGTQDLILVPPEDWSIPYYYAGPARVAMPWAGDTPADWARLRGLTAGAETVFHVDYPRASRDPRGIHPFALEAAGYRLGAEQRKGLRLHRYRMEGPVRAPTLRPRPADFDVLRLTEAWVEEGAPADTAVTVALRWQLERPVEAPLRVALHLRDAEGWTWATSDDWLLDAAARPTPRWPAGQRATTYHVLPLSPGTPPLSYTLSAAVYRVAEAQVEPLDLVDSAGNPVGQSALLGTVSLTPPLGLGAPAYDGTDRPPVWPEPATVGDGVQLAGAALDRETVAPGQPVFVTLHWWSSRTHTHTPSATLSLRQGGVAFPLDRSPLGGRYPRERWPAGQPVVEHRRLEMPAALSEGPASLILRVGRTELTVGQLEIVAGARRFTPPPMSHTLDVRFDAVGELLGYDVEQTELQAGEPVTLTLYWRALEDAGSADYTVFTHILSAEGRLVGQHDAPPAEGSRPTPGWVPGEIVVDRHVMTFREPYTGTARVEVGLYDPTTSNRVSTTGGETFVILPTPLTIGEK
jgi:4-amino-4-deoxy-L-arabinose transferase-like glycosyltransferase